MPGLALLLLLCAAGPPPEPERIGRLEHPAIREASGIVASRRFPGIFWVHNDSGNPPLLFAVRRDGTLVREYRVAAPNVDWEDIAADDAGHLYIGDIGNNGQLLALRAIHRLDEPDPAQPAAGLLPVTRTSIYTFPHGERFDAEGLVVTGGRALVFSKRLDGREAGIYAVPLDPPGTLLRPVVATRIGALSGFSEPVTAADLTPDGRLLAVASYAVARVYDASPDGWHLRGEVRYRGDGIEAIAWDGPDLVLAGEGRTLYRIPASSWRLYSTLGGIPNSRSFRILGIPGIWNRRDLESLAPSRRSRP